MWGFKYAEVGGPCPDRWKGEFIMKIGSVKRKGKGRIIREVW